MTIRLSRLRLNNFRSIDGSWEVPLDGAVTLIHGDNGAGKTTLMSAIELAATGRIAALQSHEGDSYERHLLCRGTEAGSVELVLEGFGLL